MGLIIMECPMCDGTLVRSRVKYEYKGIEFGEYEADVCDKCGEAFFTEEASDLIVERAKEFGVWGEGLRGTNSSK